MIKAESLVLDVIHGISNVKTPEITFEQIDKKWHVDSAPNYFFDTEHEAQAYAGARIKYLILFQTVEALGYDYMFNSEEFKVNLLTKTQSDPIQG